MYEYQYHSILLYSRLLFYYIFVSIVYSSLWIHSILANWELLIDELGYHSKMETLCTGYIWKEIFEYLVLEDCFSALLTCKQWSQIVYPVFSMKKKEEEERLQGKAVIGQSISLSINQPMEIIDLRNQQQQLESWNSKWPSLPWFHQSIKCGGFE